MVLFFLAELHVVREFDFFMFSLHVFLACQCMKNAVLCLTLHAYASKVRMNTYLLKILDLELVYHAWPNSILHTSRFGFCTFHEHFVLFWYED